MLCFLAPHAQSLSSPSGNAKSLYAAPFQPRSEEPDVCLGGGGGRFHPHVRVFPSYLKNHGRIYYHVYSEYTQLHILTLHAFLTSLVCWTFNGLFYYI